MKAYFQRIFRYVAWADRKSLEALRVTPGAQAEALPLLAHLLAAEHVWLSRLEQREPRCVVWPTLALEECDELAAQNETDFRTFLEQISEAQLVTSIRYRTTQGQEYVTPVIDILTHLTTHGAYHRGQIAKAIGRNGGTTVFTDFIIFARDDQPQT